MLPENRTQISHFLIVKWVLYGDSSLSVTTDMFSVKMTQFTSDTQSRCLPQPLSSFPAQFISPQQVQNILDSLKAKDITTLYVGKKTCYTDYIILASGTSHRQLASIAHKLSKILRDQGGDIPPLEVGTGDWVLLDLGNIIIHLLKQDVRDLYDFEHMWHMHEENDFITVDR